MLFIFLDTFTFTLILKHLITIISRNLSDLGKHPCVVFARDCKKCLYVELKDADMLGLVLEGNCAGRVPEKILDLIFKKL